jgi:hypothetical protein
MNTPENREELNVDKELSSNEEQPQAYALSLENAQEAQKCPEGQVWNDDLQRCEKRPGTTKEPDR